MNIATTIGAIITSDISFEDNMNGGPVNPVPARFEVCNYLPQPPNIYGNWQMSKNIRGISRKKEYH